MPLSLRRTQNVDGLVMAISDQQPLPGISEHAASASHPKTHGPLALFGLLAVSTWRLVVSFQSLSVSSLRLSLSSADAAV